MRPPRIIPPVWFLLALLAMAGLHLAVPGPALLSWPANLLGLLFVVGGVGFAGWGATLFRRAGTAVRPFEPSTVLVQEGPFRFTRNPMYVGMVAVLTGAALALGSTSPWIVVPVFFAWIDRAFVRNEEAMMRATFGAAYEEYCGRVRRWLGRRG